MDQVLTDSLERELEHRYLPRRVHQPGAHRVPVRRWIGSVVRHVSR
jgi:hypothetical protein